MFEWKDDPARAVKRIIIVGTPHSGTTLLNQVIRNCYEPIVSFGGEYSALGPRLEGEGTILTKCPKDCAILPEILWKFGDPVFIFIWRDPRDYVLPAHDGRRWIVGLWLEFSREWIDFRERYGYERVLEIKYEDFVSDPRRLEGPVDDLLADRVKRVRTFDNWYVDHKSMSDELQRRIFTRLGKRITSASVGRWELLENRDMFLTLVNKYPAEMVLACNRYFGDESVDWIIEFARDCKKDGVELPTNLRRFLKTLDV